VKAKSKAKLTESEDAATGAVGWGVYVRYFQSIGLLMTLGVVLSNVANTTSSIYASIWLERWTTDVRVLYQEPIDMWWRNLYMIIYGLLGVAQGKHTPAN
jgi:hypothetical protein